MPKRKPEERLRICASAWGFSLDSEDFGKIESVKNSLQKQFESTLVKAEDVEITNTLEQLIAKELNRNSATLETNNNLSSIINPEI